MEKVRQYLKDVQAELRKMTWPTRNEVIGSTIVVVVVAIAMSIFVGGVDVLLVEGLKLIFQGRLGG